MNPARQRCSFLRALAETRKLFAAIARTRSLTGVEQRPVLVELISSQAAGVGVQVRFESPEAKPPRASKGSLPDPQLANTLGTCQVHATLSGTHLPTQYVGPRLCSQVWLQTIKRRGGEPNYRLLLATAADGDARRPILHADRSLQSLRDLDQISAAGLRDQREGRARSPPRLDQQLRKLVIVRLLPS